MFCFFFKLVKSVKLELTLESIESSDQNSGDQILFFWGLLVIELSWLIFGKDMDHNQVFIRIISGSLLSANRFIQKSVEHCFQHTSMFMNHVNIFSLSQRLNFKRSGITCLVGKIKVKFLSQGSRTAEWVFSWSKILFLDASTRKLPGYTP